MPNASAHQWGRPLALSLALAATAQAGSNTTTFDGFNTGTVDGQHGWKATGPYDQAVEDVEGAKALRISNAVTSGSFGDMPYSAPVLDAAGENEVNNVLVNEFTFQSKTPERQQTGLKMSVSPTNGDGARMSYVRMEDSYDGVRVFFDDVPNEDTATAFTDRWIATLDRSKPHTVRFETKFVKGTDNDVVRIYLDGALKACGTSWENYYRFSEQRDPVPSDRLMWRLGSKPEDAVTANRGNGFLFDNVKTISSATGGPADCPLPVGPQGPAGQPGSNGTNGTNGTNGVDGKDGVNGANGTNGANGVNGKDGTNGVNGKDGVNSTVTLRGASIRHLQIRKISGMKFLSAKATIGGKRLSVKGRTVKVDLRGKAWASTGWSHHGQVRGQRQDLHGPPLPEPAYRPQVVANMGTAG